MPSDLIVKPPKRFFAFGCSFTKYIWATWANILAEDLRIKYNTEFYNLGKSGMGNEYMLNVAAQADAVYNFNEDDLIIVCYTNVARIDQFTHGNWQSRGNIFTSDSYKKLRKLDVNELLMKNLAYIHVTNNFIKSRGCQFHALQMCQVDKIFNQMEVTQTFPIPNLYDMQDIYKDTLAELQPSYFDVLWNGDCTPRLNWFDPHPSPIEHYQYLKKVFNYNWNEDTSKKVEIADDRIDNQVQTIIHTGVLTFDQIIQFFTRQEDTGGTSKEIVQELIIIEGEELHASLMVDHERQIR
jgi:hypothetical protein